MEPLFVLQLAALGGLLIIPMSRLYALLVLEAGAVLWALIQLERGENAILWNVVAIAATMAFALDWKRVPGYWPSRERLALRQLFGESLPQLLFNDPRRLSLWKSSP